jgi:ABC-type dipeptide/oligopeptide/nickel transport system permease component/ABC-type transport system substrate-binding protein
VLKRFLLPIASLIFLYLLFAGAAWLVRPSLPTTPLVVDPETLAGLEAGRDVSFDPEDAPTVIKRVDYSQGEAAPWFPRRESPLLRELVEEGKLPPVAERIGPQPLVMDGVDGIGNYGGTWHRIANSVGDVGIISWRMAAATLTRWSPLGYPVMPNLARDWEVNDDATDYIFHLREGIRWSDGHPVTADDILFWWEWDSLHFGIEPAFMRTGGELGQIEKMDDYTVRFTFSQPYGHFPEVMAKEGNFIRPKHYLEQYHPALGDPDVIETTRRNLRLGSAAAVYNRVKDNMNPQHPRLWPWIPRTYQGTPPFFFVRNPYYWAVDTEGNQLPYVDRIMFDVRSPDMISVSAAEGEITMQARHIMYADYTLLMSQRDRRNYDVYHWYPGVRSLFTIYPVLNRRIDSDRPETAHKHALLNEKTFRHALSLAINRKDIIRAEYNNVGEPAQIDPGPDSPFHNPRLYKSFVEYNPEEATRLLDALGLDQRDHEGYRTFPDGTRMTWYLNTTDFTGSGPAPFLIEDWAAVGVRVILRERARSLFLREQAILEHDFTVWTGESEFHPMQEPRNFVPTNGHSFYAPAYAIWYRSGGLYGAEQAARTQAAIEPPLDHPLRRTMEIYEEAIQQTGLDQQIAIFNEILEIAADNLWHISIGSPPPQPVIVQRGFKNVPRNAIFGHIYSTPANAGIETFYFDEPTETASTLARIKAQLIAPEPEVTQRAGHPGEAGAVGRLIRWLFYGIAAAGLIMVALRHPFISRRCLILIPTLIVISIINFVIIQLPPGDYMTYRITELSMQGDEAAVQQVEQLKILFDFEAPPWKQYLNWMGFTWFTTFAESDRGLIQGILGRSMEDGRLVNEVVGDRILLTVLVSVFTILFTWAFALPIGIYSAVRQYSIGDYFFTFVGFLGMCIPNFLLALILMYIGSAFFNIQATGLFSPEFSAQADWSWAKFVDFLQHVWIPVVVLGTSGTAWMIRVMRGNLLDELRKPYVITARAKGVKPMRLLLKYPVRLALNPFVSGIGSIFPQIISGGAIVAIVLSLPMVGPVLLSALMTQDLYLAASMLMVLSLLTVLGTLVSDLLLLWMDPRIRMTSGQK